MKPGISVAVICKDRIHVLNDSVVVATRRDVFSTVGNTVYNLCIVIRRGAGCVCVVLVVARSAQAPAPTRRRPRALANSAALGNDYEDGALQMLCVAGDVGS